VERAEFTRRPRSAGSGGIGVAGDGDVVGLGFQPADVEAEPGVAGEGGEHAGALAGGGFVAELGAAGEGGSGCGGGDAVVDDVDHTADGGAAVEERGGAAEDLDAVDKKRLDADAVVGADVGGIEGADAVVEHADAFAAEAADERTIRAGTEEGAAHAGGVGERGAEGGGGAATAARRRREWTCLGRDRRRSSRRGRR